MASERKYRRLPGKHRRTLSQDTLWTGEDHLLWVHSGFFREKYRRFYYKDIQYIVSRKTDRGKLFNLVLILLSVAPAPAVVYFAREFAPLAYVSGSVAVFFMILLLANLVLGATCETLLHTEVQTQRLYPLKRTRSAAKALAMLSPLIERTQADFESSGRVRASASNPPPHSASSAFRSNAPGPNKISRRRDNGAWHFALYLLLPISGLLTAVDFFHPRAILLFCVYSGFLISGVVSVVALVKQAKSDLPDALSKLTWFALAFLCLGLAGVETGRFALSLAWFPYNANNFWAFLEKAAEISPSENPLSAAVHYFFIAGGFILGIVGLFILSTRSVGVAGDSEAAAKHE